MKKAICFFAVMAVLAFGTAYAQNMVSSGLKTSSEVVKEQGFLLAAILVLTDGTNAATVTVYDANTANTGAKVVWKNTEAGANNYGGALFNPPLMMVNGAYVVISGTGASYIVYEFRK